MRICLWAGAGSGKSATASYVYSRLKQQNYKIELVNEFIKKWAYEGKVPKSFDQVFVFGSQINAEDVLIQAGVEHLITDSPLLMQVFYARKYSFPCWQQLLEIGKTFESLHPAIHIFLDRDGLDYSPDGRYESESEAKVVDEEMQSFMDQYIGEYKILKTKDLDQIIDYIGGILSGTSPAKAKVGLFTRVMRKFLS